MKKREAEFLPTLQREFADPEEYTVKPLGVGGGGPVYRVGVNTVIKVLHIEEKPQLTEYKTLMRRLDERATGEMSNYRHFFLASAFHVTKKFIFEKMEYLPHDLHSFSCKGQFTFDQLKTILCQLIYGVHLFHTLGIVLTDLKMQNVMLNPETMRVKLIDFGDSYNLGNSAKHRFMYTFLDRTRPHTIAEDTWRLGVILLGMLRFKANALLACTTPKQGKLDDSLRALFRALRTPTSAPTATIKTYAPYSFEAAVAPSLLNIVKVLRERWPTHTPLELPWLPLLCLG